MRSSSDLACVQTRLAYLQQISLLEVKIVSPVPVVSATAAKSLSVVTCGSQVLETNSDWWLHRFNCITTQKSLGIVMFFVYLRRGSLCDVLFMYLMNGMYCEIIYCRRQC